MKTVRVGDVAEQLRGVTFSKADAMPSPREGYVAVLTAGNLQDGQLITSDLTYVPAGKVSAKQQVRQNDVVICASSGSLSVVGKAAQSDGSFAGGFGAFLKVLRPGPEVDPRYFAHYFQTQAYRRTVSSLAAGANINNLKNEHLNELLLPLPPLPEQRRIATILDHADALRAKRRQVLAHLDSLAQSIFHNMFAEPDDNQTPLGEVADFFGGASLPAGESFADQPDGVLLMKVSDMNSVGNEDEIRTTTLWTRLPTPRSATVGAGAVVLPKRGASIATNKKRLTTRPTGLDPNLMGVQPRPESLTSRYLHEWFKSFDLSTITSGSTVPQLNKQDLAPLMIPIPSLDVQHEFAERVEAIHENAAAVRLVATADDELFDSLQSRAFRGEL